MPFGRRLTTCPAKQQAANRQNCLRWAGGGIDNPAPDGILDAIRPHSLNRRGARRNEYVVVQAASTLRNDAFAHGVEHQLRYAVDVQLLQDRLSVRVYRMWTEEEKRGDILTAFAFGQKLHDFAFARC
jgi:hypothetical protein